MSEPIAYFLTWTTYGSWLLGDSRGWVKWRHGFQDPNPKLEEYARGKLIEPVCQLGEQESRTVEEEIRIHCHKLGWILHAVSCRTCHVHVVVSASGSKPENVLSQLKAHCTKRLKEESATRIQCINQTTAEQRSRIDMEDEGNLDLQLNKNTEIPIRTRWWTEGGSKQKIFDEQSLHKTIDYVLNQQ